jgi:flagellar hook-associated protein 3 FlgL
MMRISNNSVVARILEHIGTSQARLQETQDRIGSGRRINRPSDDPFGTSQLLAIQTRFETALQWVRSAQVAHDDLAFTDEVLTGVNSVLQRSFELSVQADSGALDNTARAAIANELDRLIETMTSLANSGHAGRKIFAGHQTQTVPFVPDVPGNPTVVNYVGDSGLIEREIGEGERVTVNTPGDQVFTGIFATLISFRDSLRANDQPAIKVASGDLLREIDALQRVRGDVGARVRRVEMVQAQHEDEEVLFR